MTQTTETTNAIAKNIIENNVHYCQTGLIEALLQAEGTGSNLSESFCIDNITNLYPLIPAGYGELEAYCLDYGYCDKSTLDEIRLGCTEEGELNESDYEDELRELAESSQEAQDIYEWWLIDGWLAAKLKAEGEPVLDNEFGYWWGRTGTGQAAYLDAAIQNIARQSI
jgi:hypothetical protein